MFSISSIYIFLYLPFLLSNLLYLAHEEQQPPVAVGEHTSGGGRLARPAHRAAGPGGAGRATHERLVTYKLYKFQCRHSFLLK